jgi:hypothetical protein
MAGAGAAGGVSLTHVFPGIDTGPIFYMCLHGSYEMEKYLKGIEPIEIQVPDDMIIIEASNIGESCLFTRFFDVIEPLLRDRPRFLQYLSGTPLPGDTDEDKYKITLALSSCHIYPPGSTIANRILTQETGRRNSVHEASGVAIKEGARASDYGQLMRFTRHDIDGTHRQVLEPVRTRLIEEASAKENAYETYRTMFQYIEALQVEGLKIIIFPVCGTIVPTKPKAGVKVDVDFIRKIDELQKASDTTWSTLIRKSLLEVSKMYGRAKPGNGVVERNQYSLTGPVPRRAGSRRFVKKSKSKRKVRKTRKFKRLL